MPLDVWLVLVIIIFSLLGFSLEYFRSDLVAILVMSSLIITGILTAEEATRGFSSPATLTVACMFIISAVFVKAGLVEFTARLLVSWEKPNPTLSLFALMFIVGTLSAFINNTAAVAVFIPIAIKLAKVSGSTRKRFLMPLSFAAIFGGTCTLLGTSTNILVNSIYMSRGFAGFSMFEFAGVGLILSLVGMLYMMTIGRIFLGSNESEEISSNKHSYLTAVSLLKDSPSVGKKFQNSPFYNDFQQNIISFKRNGSDFSIFENATLEEGDRFLLVCSKEKILALRQRVGIMILAGNLREEEEMSNDIQIYEIVIPTNSELIGLPLNHNGLVRSQGIIPLAIRHVQKTFFRFLSGKKIAAGDVLIVAANPENFKKFQDEESLIVLSQPQEGKIDWKRMAFATCLIVALVVSTSLGYINILSAAIIVCAILLLTQTISLKEAYVSLDAQVLVLLACILSLGLALEKSGGAKIIADLFVDLSGSYGPYLVVSGLYLLTSLMTEVMSNNATAALMTPIALGIASATGLGEKPFLLAVMMAGSASFMTPVGYQTNTLIFAPGGYKFSDFLKIGTPLNIIFWLLATFLIPKFFPFITVK